MEQGRGRQGEGTREGGRRQGKRGICRRDWSVALQDPLLDMEDLEDDFEMEDVLFFVCVGFLNLETLSWTSKTILLNTLPLTMLFYEVIGHY